MRLRRTSAGIALTTIVGLLAACSTSGNSTDSAESDADGKTAPTLTIYTDQHMELVEGLTQAYTEETGIDFDIQQDANYGEVEAEGDASPADIFLSEDPAPVALLGKDGYLEDLDDEVFENVMPDLSSPDRHWVAYAARARVLYYNPDVIDEDDLPETLAEITDEQYAGEFAYAPSGAFRASTQYLLSELGEDATTDFLEQIRHNGVDEQKNGNVRDTVEAGKHAMGLSNHYYWYRKAAEVGGEENMTSKIYHFPSEDPGNLIISSGAGILSSSEHQAEAADFLDWLTSPDGGQDIIGHGDIDLSGAQYPVGHGTESDIVGSLEDVQSPPYDMGIYSDQTEAEELLKSLGMTR